MGNWAIIDVIYALQYELLLFCLLFYAVGAIDDFGFDAAYVWFRVTGRIQRAAALPECTNTTAPLAIFLPAWREADVIAPTIQQMLSQWRGQPFTLFVGCYQNDEPTITQIAIAMRAQFKVQIVVHGADGPTTKGDCLNRLWRAMEHEEHHAGRRYLGIVLHDAEDWVHRDELTLHRNYLATHAMVQIPVVPFIPQKKGLIAAHYADEFAEAHGKMLRVRHCLGASLPAAGVGCAFHREMMQFIAFDRDNAPFSTDSLVEDYELGLLIHRLGGQSILAHHVDDAGALISTRALFPMTMVASVRQKTRWITGIALAGWDRIGWSPNFAEIWMRLHDRRSIMAAIVVAAGYILAVLTIGLWLAKLCGFAPSLQRPIASWMQIMLIGSFVLLCWRLALRAKFTARQYGWRQGLLAVTRQPVANIIAIAAAGRAIVTYTRICFGKPVRWDKTDHIALDHNSVRSPQTPTGADLP